MIEHMEKVRMIKNLLSQFPEINQTFEVRGNTVYLSPSAFAHLISYYSEYNLSESLPFLFGLKVKIEPEFENFGKRTEWNPSKR